MKSTFRLASIFYFLFFIFFASCHSINRSTAELGIPASRVIFSFDDGPNDQGGTTARLLDTLKKYHIQAMFCLLGENAEHYPELVRRIYDEGHYIINHGYSEKLAGKMGDDEFKNNLVKGDAAITAALGHNRYPKLYRPHGGFYNTRQEQIFHEEGYTMIPGSIRAYDAVVAGAKRAKVVRQIIKKTEKQGGGLILLHDGRDSHSRMENELAKNPEGVFNRSWIPEAVEEIIIALLEKGFVVNNPDILTVLGFED